jgi:hypothetical protein
VLRTEVLQVVLRPDFDRHSLNRSLATHVADQRRCFHAKSPSLSMAHRTSRSTPLQQGDGLAKGWLHHLTKIGGVPMSPAEALALGRGCEKRHTSTRPPLSWPSARYGVRSVSSPSTGAIQPWTPCPVGPSASARGSAWSPRSAARQLSASPRSTHRCSWSGGSWNTTAAESGRRVRRHRKDLGWTLGRSWQRKPECAGPTWGRSSEESATCRSSTSSAWRGPSASGPRISFEASILNLARPDRPATYLGGHGVRGICPTEGVATRA